MTHSCPTLSHLRWHVPHQPSLLHRTRTGIAQICENTPGGSEWYRANVKKNTQTLTKRKPQKLDRSPQITQIFRPIYQRRWLTDSVYVHSRATKLTRSPSHHRPIECRKTSGTTITLALFHSARAVHRERNPIYQSSILNDTTSFQHRGSPMSRQVFVRVQICKLCHWDGVRRMKERERAGHSYIFVISRPTRLPLPVEAGKLNWAWWLMVCNKLGSARANALWAYPGNRKSIAPGVPSPIDHRLAINFTFKRCYTRWPRRLTSARWRFRSTARSKCCCCAIGTVPSAAGAVGAAPPGTHRVDRGRPAAPVYGRSTPAGVPIPPQLVAILPSRAGKIAPSRRTISARWSETFSSTWQTWARRKRAADRRNFASERTWAMTGAARWRKTGSSLGSNWLDGKVAAPVGAAARRSFRPGAPHFYAGRRSMGTPTTVMVRAAGPTLPTA